MPVDRALETLLRGTALEGGEGVGTRIDHTDPIALLPQSDRHPAGTATEVHHIPTGMIHRPGSELRGEDVSQMRLGDRATTTQVRHFLLLGLGFCCEAIRTGRRLARDAQHRSPTGAPARTGVEVRPHRGQPGHAGANHCASSTTGLDQVFPKS